MFIVRVNGQPIADAALAQEIGRDFESHGGHAQVLPNGDHVINISNSQYMRAVSRHLDRGLTDISRTANRFSRDAQAMLRASQPKTSTAVSDRPATPASPEASRGSSAQLTSDDLNELSRISAGAYDDLSWLNGVL